MFYQTQDLLNKLKNDKLKYDAFIEGRNAHVALLAGKSIPKWYLP